MKTYFISKAIAIVYNGLEADGRKEKHYEKL